MVIAARIEAVGGLYGEHSDGDQSTPPHHINLRPLSANCALIMSMYHY